MNNEISLICDVQKNLIDLRIKEVVLDNGTIMSADQLNKILFNDAIKEINVMKNGGGVEGGW
jgi:hypothetical protein